ncbi:hypothetical protein [Agriterribacter sp.]|uniref:hypothetical protein n=1 Tax=Agriterribacter sp. TaxID=2821509 RepID=UPI002D1F9D99|nr:hypothetical protein [Agriterribacter sp.]
MRKIKFILPILALSAIVAFAFGNRALNAKETKPLTESASERPLATTYFVFTGTNASQYTDSTKWVMSDTDDPNVTCGGTKLVCKLHSTSLSSREALVDYIDTEGIDGPSITIDQKKP